jgi:hypothetical protein
MGLSGRLDKLKSVERQKVKPAASPLRVSRPALKTLLRFAVKSSAYHAAKVLPIAFGGHQTQQVEQQQQ